MSVTLRPWRLCKHPHSYFTATARLLSATEPIQLTLLIDDNWFDHTFYHLKQASCSDFADRGKVVPHPTGEEEDRKGARYCDRVWTVGHVSATQFIVDHGYLPTKSVLVSDFADEFPDAEVIGTDVSPIQPTWVPPNVKFELDDCNREWTWGENTIDFVNMRFLEGIVDDWDALFRNAYRVCKPGSWVESLGTSATIMSHDGNIKDGSAMHQWGKVFQEGGKRLGKTFAVWEEDLQRKGMEAAGFVDIQFKDYEISAGGGGWHPDPKAREKGLWYKLAAESDLDG